MDAIVQPAADQRSPCLLWVINVVGQCDEDCRFALIIMSDFLPGYEASSWQGLVATKNTPAEIVDLLNKAINAGLTDLTIRARLTDLGNEALSSSPSEFGKLIADETEKWAKVIRATNVRAE